MSEDRFCSYSNKASPNLVVFNTWCNRRHKIDQLSLLVSDHLFFIRSFIGSSDVVTGQNEATCVRTMDEALGNIAAAVATWDS